MEGGRELQLPTSLSQGKERPRKPQQNLSGSHKILTRHLDLETRKTSTVAANAYDNVILVISIDSGECYTILSSKGLIGHFCNEPTLSHLNGSRLWARTAISSLRNFQVSNTCKNQSRVKIPATLNKQIYPNFRQYQYLDQSTQRLSQQEEKESESARRGI